MARGNRSRVCTAWLLILVLAHGAAAIGRNDLYPYASGNTLKQDGSGNLVSAEVTLKTPIVLYDKTYNTIFVNGNGILSFLRPMSRFYNIPFPLDDPVVAPLYTHVDTRASGNIFWVESMAPDVLSRAKATIQRSFKKGKHFEPTSVFLATWKDVGYYNNKGDKVNTYQVAISTNGTHSYAELIYPENDVQWIQAESHPNGLPDAKAQAGFMSEGKMYSLLGSGTDQIQNIDKWSNVDTPGHWVFQIGPIQEGRNIETPDAIENKHNEKYQTCHTCHNKAVCADYQAGYCCICKDNYFGNGKSCLLIDNPLRVIGKLSGTINDETFEEKDMQCYVQTKDGRTYTALSRVPENFGPSFQLMTNMGGIIGWLFAKPVGETKNGYQLTGGVFNHTFEIFFTTIGSSITVRSRFSGLDVFGQLKMDVYITGSLPILSKTDRVEFTDFEEIFTRTQPGSIRSSSSRTYKMLESKMEYPVTVDQIISFNECKYAPTNPDQDTMKLKFSRGIISYEAQEGIIRFAMNGKMTPLEEEDPCIQGKSTCVTHSSCVVEGDDFKCVCNPGYQYLYDMNGNATCVDINECTAGNHVCSPNAVCINNEGSHSCQCKPGLSGDGRTCEKLPTCDETQCWDYEQCSMINGSPQCVCIPGYESSDEGCVPAGAGHGSGTGHGSDTSHGSGTGHGSDMSHGSDDGGREQVSCDVLNNCSPHAMCSFDGNKHMYVCVCTHGYIGNGYQCWSERDGNLTEQIPVPQCLVGVCWCPSNWEYRKGVCVRQDDMQGSGDGIHDHECNDHHDCKNNERCNYVSASNRYECTCNQGYSKVNGNCMVSDCSTNPSLCHINGQCIFAKDGSGYKCICIAGYHGDGVNQCLEDNIGCNVLNTCGRNAVCGYNQTSANYVCVCKPGFYGDGYSCVSQSSCGKDEISDGGICRPDPRHEANFLLVNQGISTHKIPFYPKPNNPGGPIYVTDKQIAVAIDIDCQKKRIYLSDIISNKITSLSYNGSKVESFMFGVGSPEGISVDWVSRNLFWTDSVKGTVEAANLDTRRKIVLINQGLVNPRGIAVHPYRGKLFWSDWNRVDPKLEWANEDGTDRQLFLRGDKVNLPNSLCIDWSTDELCWSDAGTLSINCANIDTKYVTVAVKDLSYPFGLAISQNHYYWTDWKTHKIEVAPKSTGERQKAISIPPGGSGKLYDIVAVPENCPEVTNVCEFEHGYCTKEQLCLPDGHGGRSCLCADNAVGECSSIRFES